MKLVVGVTFMFLYVAFTVLLLQVQMDDAVVHMVTVPVLVNDRALEAEEELVVHSVPPKRQKNEDGPTPITIAKLTEKLFKVS